MSSVVFLAGLLVCFSDIGVLASSNKIFEYQPITKVVDDSAIDLDQKDIIINLNRDNSEGFKYAKSLYGSGGHSKSFALLSLDEPLSTIVPKDTEVSSINSSDGNTIKGKVFKDARQHDTSIYVSYNNDDNDHSNRCMVGAGGMDPVNDGCFSFTGNLNIHTTKPITASYYYDPITDNHNDRTIKKLSSEAGDTMWHCYGNHCPHDDYKKFYNYFGTFTYADEFIEKAFETTTNNNDGNSNNAAETTAFKNGNINFKNYSIEGRSEIIKKATVTMNIWMFIIHCMEEAINDCLEGCDMDDCDDLHNWDKAVAYYTGSSVAEKEEEDGYLMYGIANENCKLLNTCGIAGASTNGTSKVNSDIFEQFNYGKKNILRNDCDALQDNKEKIVSLMTIPLIQGVLHNSYYSSGIVQDSDPTEEEKYKALNAVYTVSILPIIDNCVSNDGVILYENNINDSNDNNNAETKFKMVKRSLEKSYECIGIKCSDVGGLFDGYSKEYMRYAEPCNDDDYIINDDDSKMATKSSNENKNADVVNNVINGGDFLLTVFFTAIILASILIVVLLIDCCAWKDEQTKLSSVDEMPEESPITDKTLC